MVRIAYLQKKDKRLGKKMDKLFNKVDKLAEQRKLVKKEMHKEVFGYEVKDSKQDKSIHIFIHNILPNVDGIVDNSNRGKSSRLSF
jgi:hypothetical protein